jgi:hypothetical protein
MTFQENAGEVKRLLDYSDIIDEVCKETRTENDIQQEFRNLITSKIKIFANLKEFVELIENLTEDEFETAKIQLGAFAAFSSKINLMKPKTISV